MISSTIDKFIAESFDRALFVVQEPLKNEELIWALIPIIVTLILIEIYFGRYRREELGWNTAFGNSLILIFVSADLIKYSIRTNILGTDPIKTGIIVGLITVGFIITFVDFFHMMPREWAFAISSKLPTSFLAIISMLFIYIDIPIDYITATALFLLLLNMYIVLIIIHHLIPAFRGLFPEEVPDPILEED
ncbi:hypothetical protein J4438_00060 [Candidatus Woesearchaeota archaeon]|nr:hypothetical protein [Candidatus Woesearchaeota archaeon]